MTSQSASGIQTPLYMQPLYCYLHTIIFIHYQFLEMLQNKPTLASCNQPDQIHRSLTAKLFQFLYFASSVHGIFQARVLQWVAIPFSRGSSQPGDRTQVSCITGRFLTIWATREAFLSNDSVLLYVVDLYITYLFSTFNMSSQFYQLKINSCLLFQGLLLWLFLFHHLTKDIVKLYKQTSETLQI